MRIFAPALLSSAVLLACVANLPNTAGLEMTKANSLARLRTAADHDSVASIDHQSRKDETADDEERMDLFRPYDTLPSLYTLNSDVVDDTRRNLKALGENNPYVEYPPRHKTPYDKIRSEGKDLMNELRAEAVDRYFIFFANKQDALTDKEKNMFCSFESRHTKYGEYNSMNEEHRNSMFKFASQRTRAYSKLKARAAIALMNPETLVHATPEQVARWLFGDRPLLLFDDYHLDYLLAFISKVNERNAGLQDGSKSDYTLVGTLEDSLGAEVLAKVLSLAKLDPIHYERAKHMQRQLLTKWVGASWNAETLYSELKLNDLGEDLWRTENLDSLKVFIKLYNKENQDSQVELIPILENKLGEKFRRTYLGAQNRGILDGEAQSLVIKTLKKSHRFNEFFFGPLNTHGAGTSKSPRHEERPGASINAAGDSAYSTNAQSSWLQQAYLPQQSYPHAEGVSSYSAPQVQAYGHNDHAGQSLDGAYLYEQQSHQNAIPAEDSHLNADDVSDALADVHVDESHEEQPSRASSSRSKAISKLSKWFGKPKNE